MSTPDEGILSRFLVCVNYIRTQDTRHKHLSCCAVTVAIDAAEAEDACIAVTIAAAAAAALVYRRHTSLSF